MSTSRLELIDANALLGVARRLAFAAAERQQRKRQLGLGDVRPATDAEMLETLRTLETITQRIRGRLESPRRSATASRFMSPAYLARDGIHG